MPNVAEDEDEEGQVLRKLKPKIPDHNDAHPMAEDMRIRKDSGLRLWRMADPYATRRRTAVDYRFHTKEQYDFYETILLDKKPIVCDMRWVDWKFINLYVDTSKDCRRVGLEGPPQPCRGLCPTAQLPRAHLWPWAPPAMGAHSSGQRRSASPPSECRISSSHLT